MNPHPADLELSGTHRTAQPRVGKQFLGLGQKPHDPPLTWHGLVAEGVSAEAHVTWQTPEHYGEQGGPGCSGKS